MTSAGGTYAGPQSADRRRARRKAAWRRRGTVALFMSPWIAGFTIFFGYPLVMSGYYSLTHYDLLSPPRWVGLATIATSSPSTSRSGRRCGTRSG